MNDPDAVESQERTWQEHVDYLCDMLGLGSVKADLVHGDYDMTLIPLPVGEWVSAFTGSDFRLTTISFRQGGGGSVEAWVEVDGVRVGIVCTVPARSMGATDLVLS